jgi:hypothetical protein
MICNHRGRAVEGMNCLRLLDHRDRGFESHSKHGFLSAFILFVLSCIGNGHAMSWFPVGVQPTVLGLRNWSETKRFTDALCSKVGAIGKEKERQNSTHALRHNIVWNYTRNCTQKVMWWVQPRIIITVETKKCRNGKLLCRFDSMDYEIA